MGRHASLAGRPFVRMTGSGNDFIFFDNRDARHDDLADPVVIEVICHRRTGLGADGIVLLDAGDADHAFGMRYYNRDGSLAEMCGNAALCSVRLASQLGIGDGGDVTFRTPSGPVTGRMTGDVPEIDMTAVTELALDAAPAVEAGERRIGYARVGVPHLVVRCETVEDRQVERRGRALRHHPSLAAGANVNFVSRDPGGRWHMRTYERGVEAETLACGTGAVATAALIEGWGESTGELALVTRSGRTVHAAASRGSRPPILRGEGRIIAEGRIVELPVADP